MRPWCWAWTASPTRSNRSFRFRSSPPLRRRAGRRLVKLSRVPLLLLADAGEDFPGTVAPLVHLAGTCKTFDRIRAAFSFRRTHQVGFSGRGGCFAQRAIAIRAMQLAGLEYPVETFAHKNHAVLQFFPEHRFPSSRFFSGDRRQRFTLEGRTSIRAGARQPENFGPSPQTSEIIRAWPKSRAA